MKPLIKISNSELSYRLNLNYNNVYSRLRMKLGSKASLFADISTKSTGTTWYSDDDAEYMPLSEASKGETNNLIVALNNAVSAVRKELKDTPELADYVDDILEIPSNDFVFYRKSGDGYKLILAGWGCKYAHQSASDPNAGFIKRLAKKMDVPDVPVEKPVKQDIGSILADLQEKESTPAPTVNITEPVDVNLSDTAKPIVDETANSADVKQQEVKPQGAMPIKTQHVVVRVLDQANNPIDGEDVVIHTSAGNTNAISSERGLIEVGDLHYGESFSVSFPNLTGNPERTFEVEKNVEMYDAFVKKLTKYTPVLFIEDQNGSTVQDYNVKILIKGQETVYNSGQDGVIQLPTMLDGQRFVVIDTANYANTKEYNVTQTEAKAPYHFHVRSAEKTKVGITVLNVSGKPIPQANVSLQIGDIPCQQITDEKGRAEFPSEFLVPGIIPVDLNIKGTGLVKSDLKYQPEISEYTIQLRGKKRGFDWRWLGLLPLLALLGWGGYTLYDKLLHKTPTIAEMESGVVLIQTLTSYTVDCSVDGVTWTADGKPTKFYFTYDDNNKKIVSYTHLEDKRPWSRGMGTGFLISEDGLIATNRHVANPIAPKDIAQVFKKKLADDQENLQRKLENLNDWLREMSADRNRPGIRVVYADSIKKKRSLEDEIRTLDRVLKIGKFNVEVENHCSVAFTNSIIETWNDFIGCSLRTEDDVADNYDKDVAIIQLKNKKRDVPEDAFIFEIPEKDLMDEDIPDNYEITVLGYNEGIELADIKNGIHPQAQTGKIMGKGNDFEVEYSANTLPGSSGSPVFNNKGQLVAVNHSSVVIKAFAYGIRTKYLRELYEKLQTKNNKSK